MKALLKYTFIFDPTETWDSSDNFEASLASLLKNIGLQAERVNTGKKDADDQVLIISRIPDMVEDLPGQRSVEDQLKTVKGKILPNKDAKGRFVKSG